MKKVMRNKKVIAMMVVGLVAIFLAASGVVASPPMFGDDPPVESKINYQGQLTDDAGNPLNGTYDMEFLFYDSATGGSQVGTTITENDVAVTNGLFNVKLDVNQADFNGQGLWLEVMVEGETLSPRQEILPVPYALSLKPGAKIEGDSNYGLSSITTGSYGLYGESSSASFGAGVLAKNTGGVGDGIQAISDGRAGIYARGDGATSYAGYFSGDVHITEDLSSGADSYIFISGNNFIKDQDTDSTRWNCWGNGAAAIWRGGTAGTKIIYIPITVPGVLYGQEVKVEELTIYYECQDGTKNYITATLLSKQTGADSGATIVYDTTDRNINTATSYTLSLTANNVLSSNQGILCLQLRLNFEDNTNYILLGGARLRLSHS